MTKKTKIVLLTIIAFLIAAVGFITYSWFVPNEILGNITNNVMSLVTTDYGNVTITYDNDNNQISVGSLDLNDETAGSTLQYILKFNAFNDSTKSQYITFKWGNLVNSFCQYRNNDFECTNNSSDTYVGNELTYELYSCTNTQYAAVTTADDTDISACTKISAQTNEAVPVTGSTSKLQTSSKITLTSQSTTYYIVRINLLNLTTNQNYQQDKTFSGGVIVDFASLPRLTDEILAAHPPVSDAIASTYVTSATGVDFNAISSLTNGQGLYINNKVNIANDPTTGLVKYFRGGTFCAYTGYASEVEAGTQCTTAGGAWTNYTCYYDLSKSACEGIGFTWYELKNNVKFADKYWKIIRIDEDGNIRLLFNGNATNTTGADSQYGKSTFNSLYTDAAYVGYMIPNFTGNTTSVEEATRNDTNSTIKGAVDDFYDEVLGSYTDKIADSSYCGYRSITSGPGFGASTTDYTYYEVRTRLLTNKTPTYSCPSSNDLYTMPTSLVGNKKLTKSIGLVSADEVTYAGGKYNTANYTYYMQSGYYYWTMSPFYFSPTSGTASAWVVYTTGVTNYSRVYGDTGVRPVVSLKPTVTVTDGTGTLEDPWIVAS